MRFERPIALMALLVAASALAGCGGTISEHALGSPGKPVSELARIYSNPDPFIEQVDLTIGPNKAAGSWQVRPMVFNSAFDGAGTISVDAGVVHVVKLFCRGEDGGLFDPGMHRSPTRWFTVVPAPGELVTFSLLNSRNPYPNPECRVVTDSPNAQAVDAKQAEEILAWIAAGRPAAAAAEPAPAPDPAPVVSPRPTTIRPNTVQAAPAPAQSAPSPKPGGTVLD